MKSGIILALNFVQSTNKKFSAYIDYIDREIAVRNNSYSLYNTLTSSSNVQQDRFSDYQEYINYMGNPQKTDELFTQANDTLSDFQKRLLKNAFDTAQKNKSLMWQGVLSFDTEWLTEMGIYNSQYKILNENTIKSATRAAVQKLLAKEQLDRSAQWCAAIHYNTDNIHVHIAIVEPYPMRKQKEINGQLAYVGRMKQSSINQAKAKAVNILIQNKDLNIKINQIIRDKIISKAQNKSLINDKKFKDELLAIYNKLPSNPKEWNYRSHSMKFILPQLDKLTEYYLNSYHAKDMLKLNNYLKQQENLYRQAYGEKYVNNFAQNKINDLYYRLGNTILKELREYDKKRKEELYRHANNRKIKIKSSEYSRGVNLSILTYHLQRLAKSLIDEKEHYLAQLAYEEMQEKNNQEQSD